MKATDKEKLKAYCKEKNIKYSSIIARVRNMMKKDETLTEEEAINFAIKNYKKINYTYKIYDVPLKKICEQLNLNERKIIHKYNKEYKNRDDISMDEALTEIIEFYKKPPKANTKYLYHNRPVKEICKEKGISDGSVFSIYRRKYKDRDDLTMDEAFEEIFDHFDKKKKELPKYMYHGRSVKEICEEKGLNPESVITRYRKKYKDKENITMDEAFEEILNHFINSKKTEKILYKGRSVKEICKEKNLNYNKVIKMYREDYKYRTDIIMDDAFAEIFEYYENNPENKEKYLYKNNSVRTICEEKSLSYEKVIAMYRRRYEKNKDLSMDDAFEEIFEYYENPNAREKFLYKNTPVKEICEEKNLDYERVLERRRKKYKNRNDLTMDEIFEEIFAYYENPNAKEKYLYKNTPVKKLCEQKGLKYRTITDKYRNDYSNRKDISMDDAFAEIFEYYEKVKIKNYCSDNDLNYKYIMEVYEKEYKNKNDLTIDEVLKEIVENNPNSKIIYYIENTPIEKYCLEEGIDYNTVIKLYKMKRTYRKKRETTMIEAVREVMDNTPQEEKERRKLFEQIRQTNKVFEILDNKENLNDNDRQETCQKLNIDYTSVSNLVEMNLNFREAVNLIWYFSDTTKENKKSISYPKIIEILLLSNKLNIKSKEEIKKLEIYDLIGIYKSGLSDCKEAIFIKEEYYFNRIIESISNTDYINNITEKDNQAFIEELKNIYISILDNTKINEEEKLLEYLNSNIKENFINYIKNYSIQKQDKKRKIKYKINGVPLKQICEEKGLNYNSVLAKYKREYKNRDDLTEEEKFEEISKTLKTRKRKPKYEINGVPLKEICEEKGLNYNSVLTRYRREYKNRDDLTEEEKLEEISKDLKTRKRKPKYEINGVPLKEICEEKGLSYNSVLTRYRREYKNRDDLTEEEKLEEVLKTLIIRRPKYEINGVPLKKICEEKGLNYNSIVAKYKREYESRDDLTEEEKLEEVLKTLKTRKAKRKYEINGIPLKKICEEKGLNYSSVLKKYKREYENRDDLTEEEKFKEISRTLKTRKREVRYKINGIPLSQICKEEDLSYNSVLYRYRNHYKERNDLTEEEKIKEALKDLKNKNSRKKVVSNLKQQETLTNNSKKQLKPIKNKEDKTAINNLEIKDALIEEPPKQLVLIKNKDVVDKKEKKDTQIKEKPKEKIKKTINNNFDFKKPIFSKGKKETKPKKDTVYIKNNNYNQKPVSTQNKLFESTDRINKIPFPTVLIDKLELLFKEKIDESQFEHNQPITKEKEPPKKYKVDGVDLIKYCKENSVNYYITQKVFKENYEGSRFISESDAFKEILNELKTGKNIGSYIESRLKKDNKDIDFVYVGRIYREKYEGREDITKAQAIKKIVTEIREGTYYGNTLEEYCNQNNYPYLEMSSRILNLKARYSKIPNEKLLERAKEEYQKHRKIDAKDKLQTEFLFTFDFSDSRIKQACESLKLDFNTTKKLKDMGFSYIESMAILLCYSDKVNEEENSVLSSQRLEKIQTFKKINTEPKVDNSIYLKKIGEQENYIMQAINKLDEIDIETAKRTCEKLHISFESVFFLSEFYGNKTAINLIWYFSEKENSKGYKTLSLEEANRINIEVAQIKAKTNAEILEMDTYFLTSIYKCNLYDSRRNIIEKENNYFNHLINNISERMTINEDTKIILINKLQELLLDAIDKINTNDPTEMLKSMDVFIKKGFTRYLNNPQIRKDNKIYLKK